MARRALIVVAKASALALLAGAFAFAHHTRIRVFLHAVQGAFAAALPRGLRGPAWDVQPSVLTVRVGGDSAAHYEVRVRHKARALELSLQFTGSAEENERWSQAMLGRAAEIQEGLGYRLELERATRRRTVLRQSLPLTGDPKEPISVSLTNELAKEAGLRLAAFVEALEPLVTTARGPEPARRPRSAARR